MPSACLLSCVTLADIQQSNSPQDTWQFGLRLRRKSQGTSNGLEGKDACMGCITLCYVGDSVVSAPYSTALCLQDIERSVLCPSSKLERLRRLVAQGGTCARATRNLPCRLARGGTSPKSSCTTSSLFNVPASSLQMSHWDCGSPQRCLLYV
jgi:hypothetical protein